MAKVLVVGGAGYVGGTTCARLLNRGHEVYVLDDLSTGHPQLVSAGVREFVRARAGSPVAAALLSRERFDCVMHFAAKAIVSESVEKPEEYYENNVLQTRALLEAMLAAGVKRLVFSSTCAIFGDPGGEPIDESMPKNPLSPYGENKLEVERELERLARSHGVQAVALRYFNAAGAEEHLRAGEWHTVETHLIPRVLKAERNGTPIDIYGTDYVTPDGTCVRDYIHVSDLADAHEAAMLRLLSLDPASGCFEAYNLGSENGYSVREIIHTVENLTGNRITVAEKPPRSGDPAILVADSSLAKKRLGFKPALGLDEIIRSAIDWEHKLAAIAKKAVFLDRDGTINEDPGYLSHPDQLRLFPGVPEALAALNRAGFLLIVVSNQSGVGRGLFTRDALPAIHERLDELLSRADAKIDRYELCLHKPEDGCECRKPKPKLLFDAARALDIDLSRSYFVGDKESDIQVARAAGLRAAALVRTGAGKDTEHHFTRTRAQAPEFIGDSLREAAAWILSRENATR